MSLRLSGIRPGDFIKNEKLVLPDRTVLISEELDNVILEWKNKIIQSKRKKFLRSRFFAIFRSQECIDFILPCFWRIMFEVCWCGKKGNLKFKKLIVRHHTSKYVRLLFRINKNKRRKVVDFIMARFPEYISSLLFRIFSLTFPEDTKEFNSNWKVEVYKRNKLWLSGTRDLTLRDNFVLKRAMNWHVAPRKKRSENSNEETSLKQNVAAIKIKSRLSVLFRKSKKEAEENVFKRGFRPGIYHSRLMQKFRRRAKEYLDNLDNNKQLLTLEKNRFDDRVLPEFKSIESISAHQNWYEKGSRFATATVRKIDMNYSISPLRRNSLSPLVEYYFFQNQSTRPSTTKNSLKKKKFAEKKKGLRKKRCVKVKKKRLVKRKKGRSIKRKSMF